VIEDLYQEFFNHLIAGFAMMQGSESFESYDKQAFNIVEQTHPMPLFPPSRSR
jgi:hypothetical protein